MIKRARVSIILVLLVALVAFGAFYGAWSFLTPVVASPANTNSKVALVIQDGETVQQIADDLYAKGLIRNALAFRLWAKLTGPNIKLEAGAYLLSPGMTPDQIIAKLQNGQPDEKRLLVIDGWRLEQIATQASTLGLANFSAKDFLNYAHHPSQFPHAAQYPILQHASSMEGFVFPDTYLIPMNYTTVQVIDMMLTEFDQVVQKNNLVALAQKYQLSEYQLITLASMVQREASNNGQMPLISGIYWKRINEPSQDVGGAYLGSDPTVEYAYDTDHVPAKGLYWKDLNSYGTGSSVEVDSPWNTYTHQGWPPTPISSPSLIAMQAAATPTKTDCYYFFTKPSDGSLVCAQTLLQIQQLEKQDGLN